ncbi:MAG TPA: ribonuclease HIII, partial [Bacillales bacterium]|nr:ribonuclease HIII [Bacillales bacterium]
MGELKVGQAVIKCSKPTIEKMKRFYGPYIQAKQPEASVFFVKLPSCAITAYRSGKVLFQGKSAEQEAEQWQQTAEKNEAVVQKKVVKKHAKASIYDPPSNIGSLSLIGSDEVGTGDYFGPITVAAVFVAKEQLRELGELGLKDSKLLNDRQIYDLAESVKPVVVHCLLTLRNPKYNELRDQGMTQGKMKAMLHNQALNHVLRKLDGKPYDGILIDQFAEP